MSPRRERQIVIAEARLRARLGFRRAEAAEVRRIFANPPEIANRRGRD